MTEKTGKAHRINLLNEMADLNGSAWAGSSNPVKKRIGRLEIAWREGLQWLMEDVQKMFANFTTVGDAYDTVDVNVASVKSLCIEKGLFTDEEFKARQKYFFGVLDRERERRHAALMAASVAQPAPTEDANTVDPGLLRMNEAARATTDEDHVPKHATMFGG